MNIILRGGGIMKVLENKDIYLNEVLADDSHHHYKVFRKNSDINDELLGNLFFQKGGRNEEGSVDGLCHEDIYNIMIDRLEVFANGDLSTPETVKQLELLKECLELSNKRLQDRYDRGVIGTNEK